MGRDGGQGVAEDRIGAKLGLSICCSKSTCEYSAANCMQCKYLDSLFAVPVNSVVSTPKCAPPAASARTLSGNGEKGKSTRLGSHQSCLPVLIALDLSFPSCKVNRTPVRVVERRE